MNRHREREREREVCTVCVYQSTQARQVRWDVCHPKKPLWCGCGLPRGHPEGTGRQLGVSHAPTWPNTDPEAPPSSTADGGCAIEDPGTNN